MDKVGMALQKSIHTRVVGITRYILHPTAFHLLSLVHAPINFIQLFLPRARVQGVKWLVLSSFVVGVHTKPDLNIYM